MSKKGQWKSWVFWKFRECRISRCTCAAVRGLGLQAARGGDCFSSGWWPGRRSEAGGGTVSPLDGAGWGRGPNFVSSGWDPESRYLVRPSVARRRGRKSTTHTRCVVASFNFDAGNLTTHTRCAVKINNNKKNFIL